MLLHFETLCHFVKPIHKPRLCQLLTPVWLEKRGESVNPLWTMCVRSCPHHSEYHEVICILIWYDIGIFWSCPHRGWSWASSFPRCVVSVASAVLMIIFLSTMKWNQLTWGHVNSKLTWGNAQICRALSIMMWYVLWYDMVWYGMVYMVWHDVTVSYFIYYNLWFKNISLKKRHIESGFQTQSFLTPILRSSRFASEQASSVSACISDLKAAWSSHQ